MIIGRSIFSAMGSPRANMSFQSFASTLSLLVCSPGRRRRSPGRPRRAQALDIAPCATWRSPYASLNNEGASEEEDCTPGKPLAPICAGDPMAGALERRRHEALTLQSSLLLGSTRGSKFKERLL